MSWQTIVKGKELDVSIVPFNKLGDRIDAEYYRPEFLEIENKINTKKWQFLDTKLAKITGGNAYKSEDFGTGNIRVAKITDVSNRISVESWETISYEGIDSFPKRFLQQGDILFSGTHHNPWDLGKVFLIENLPTQSTFNQRVFCIRFLSINQYFAYVTLKTKFLRKQIERFGRGNNQLNLNLTEINQIKFPIPSSDFQSRIESLVKEAYLLENKSKKEYQEAEQTLLKEINLERYKGTDEAISVRNFMDCLADQRFDAEYWQPDYDVILDTLSKYNKGVSTIGDEFKQLKSNFKAEKDKEYNYVEIGDVNVSTGEVEYNPIIGAELPANAKIKFGKRQLITSKVRPNRGATTILDNHESYIGSGAFTVLTEQDNINLETLMVYLKARPIRELLLRYNTGTSYPVITDADVLKLPIPLIDKTVQKKISELVSISATERQQAKELLEKAKRAVEIFVEQNEKKALKYLNL